MSATVLERDMLKTRIPERDISVTTFLNQRFGPAVRHPWTAVWAYPRGGPYADLVWLHVWQGATTPGGLDEAHASVVARVRAGELPAQGADDPTRTPLLRGALIAGGALPGTEEEQ